MERTPKPYDLGEIGRIMNAEAAVRDLERRAAWAEVQRRISRAKQNGPINGYDLGLIADILEPVERLDRRRP